MWFKEQYAILKANPRMTLTEQGILWNICAFAWERQGITEKDLLELSRTLREPLENIRFVWMDFIAVAEEIDGKFMLAEHREGVKYYEQKVAAGRSRQKTPESDSKGVTGVVAKRTLSTRSAPAGQNQELRIKNKELKNKSNTTAAAVHARAHEEPPPPPPEKNQPKTTSPKSVYPEPTILAFVLATKKHATNPAGLARHLLETAEDDLLIAGWLAEREKQVTAIAVAARDAQDRALEISARLLQQGSVKTEYECVELLEALGFFAECPTSGSDFNAATFRQLKKMVAQSLALLEQQPEVEQDLSLLAGLATYGTAAEKTHYAARCESTDGFLISPWDDFNDFSQTQNQTTGTLA